MGSRNKESFVAREWLSERCSSLVIFVILVGSMHTMVTAEETNPYSNGSSRRSATSAALNEYISAAPVNPAAPTVAEDVLAEPLGTGAVAEVSDEYCDPCTACPGFHERMRATWWGYPRYFYERPHGSFARAHLGASIMAGAADRMVLYRYDFANSPPIMSSQLNQRGERELRRIADMVLATGMPLVIESSDGNEKLDEKRRDSVVQMLEKWSIPVPPDMVVVARPTAMGISGLEASLIYQNQLSQTFNYGVLGGSAGATGVAPAGAFGAGTGSGGGTGGALGGGLGR